MSYQDLAVHTFTTKPWSISECIEGYAKRGIGGISIWRETVEGEDLCSVAKHVRDAGLVLHAGHGLTYRNVRPVAAIAGMCELNIGHSIVSRAVFVGMTEAVREMKALIA